MNPSQTIKAKNTSPQADYAWLERTRQIFQQQGHAPDNAVLYGIIAEGQARLGKVTPDDPLLAGYLRLAVAEAQLNLALDQSDEAERQQGFAAGRQNCEQAAEEARTAGSGVACNILPRALTLLSVLYKAAPEARQPDLAECAQSIAADLDRALQEQAFLRQSALEGLQSARLLLASLEGLPLEERRALLTQAAGLMLNAGDLFLEAGDTDMLAQVQADLVEVKKSLDDPIIPMPRLALFATPVNPPELLPEALRETLNADQEVEPESEVPPPRPLHPPPARPTRRQRTSPLRWALSIGGLVVSCLMMFCSGASLLSGLYSTTRAQDSALSQTQAAISVQLTLQAQSVQEQVEVATQPSPTSTPQEEGVVCPGAPASRLQIGYPASVGDVGGFSLTIYADAGYQSEELYYLEEGDFLSIIGGPVCVQNQLWWEVNLDQGNTGWAPESSETGAYLLNP